jgi:predicted AlkP superfamily phosphohydrolase/phosphomutase
LRLRGKRFGSSAVARAKDLALTRLPPRVREKLFRGFGAVLPGLVESRARFAAIDMRHTTVFSDELNYFPALHFNLRGREPHGQLAPSDVPRVVRELEAYFENLRDPWTGERVVTQVWPREALFHGPVVERAPDLLLELSLASGYSYNLMPSASAPGNGAFRKLSPPEYLGRKGRSLPGSHRPRGLFIGCGPSVDAVGEIDAAMADVSATLLARMQLSHLHACDGRALDEILTDGSRATVPQPLAAIAAPAQRTELTTGAVAEARVEERLRRLGYIE